MEKPGRSPGTGPGERGCFRSASRLASLWQRLGRVGGRLGGRWYFGRWCLEGRPCGTNLGVLRQPANLRLRGFTGILGQTSHGNVASTAQGARSSRWQRNGGVRGCTHGPVSIEEDPCSLSELTAGEVVTKAKEMSKRDFLSLIDKRPFLGLVKSRPRKALAALTIYAKKGDYPEEFWSEMINHVSELADIRLKRVFLNRLLRLPNQVIVELRFTLSRWLEKNLIAILKFDECLSWALYDHIIEGVISGGASATASGCGEVMLKGKVTQRSRRTYDHAINGPIGMCVEALFRITATENREVNSSLPDYIKGRIERLFSAEGEGSDHAVSVIFSRLSWLMFVNPAWTKSRLIPMLAFDHPAAEPAWNGFLHNAKQPCAPLLEIIKPQLVNLFPWIKQFSWSGRLTNIAAQWLGWMRVFHPDKAIGLSQREMRSIIRSMSESTRNQFIHWLSLVGQHKDNDWNTHVVPRSQATENRAKYKSHKRVRGQPISAMASSLRA